MRRMFYSFVKGNLCPWCGKKWLWTKARRALVKRHGHFELICKCGKTWRVMPKEEGFSYIEL